MTGLTVLVLVLVGLRLIELIGRALADRTPAPRKVSPLAMDPCLGPIAARPALPRSAEGELAARLAAGAISRERYRRAMAGLAAADADHPLVLPTD